MEQEVDLAIEKHEDLKVVRASYLRWFVWSAILAALASILAWSFKSFQEVTAMQIRFSYILTAITETTALGQLGVEIQTWGGTSPAERLNKKLYNIFTSTAIFLLIFSVQLEY